MKTLIYIISLVFISSALNAQVPGYQGKTLFFEAGISTMITFQGPTANNRGLKRPKQYPYGKKAQSSNFAFSTRFRAGLYWTFSRKNNLRLNYDYAQTGLVVYDLSSPSKGSSETQDEHDIFYRLHMHSIDLGMDIYIGRVSLAPLGMYLTPSLKFLFSKGQPIDQYVHYANEGLNSIMNGEPNVNFLNPIEIKTSKLDVALGIQWGYRNILFDRLTLNFAIEHYLFPGLVGIIFGNSNWDRDTRNYNTQRILRLQLHHLMNIHIGVGVLLY